MSLINTLELGLSNIPIGFRKTNLTAMALLYLFLGIVLTERMKKIQTEELEVMTDMVGLKGAYAQSPDGTAVENDGNYWTPAAHISCD